MFTHDTWLYMREKENGEIVIKLSIGQKVRQFVQSKNGSIIGIINTLR